MKGLTPVWQVTVPLDTGAVQCSDVMKGHNPAASSGAMGLTYGGFPLSHTRKPAAATDNDLINISLTQQANRDEMEFIHTSKFQTQRSEEEGNRVDQSNAGVSALVVRDNWEICRARALQRIIAINFDINVGSPELQ